MRLHTTDCWRQIDVGTAERKARWLVWHVREMGRLVVRILAEMARRTPDRSTIPMDMVGFDVTATSPGEAPALHICNTRHTGSARKRDTHVTPVTP